MKRNNKKAFTLIELSVAVGILVIMLLFAAGIFNVSIDSQRTAMANAEIMQKLRAITDRIAPILRDSSGGRLARCFSCSILMV